MGFSHRYDIRNRLEDKGQFGLKPILPRRRRREEEELEEELDRERYLGLGVDILEHELLEGVPTIPQFFTNVLCVCVCVSEESRKREREHTGGYQAVGFAYKESDVVSVSVAIGSDPAPPRRPDHPPTSTVDVAENESDRFLPPAGLDIPGHIQQVPMHALYLSSYCIYHLSISLSPAGDKEATCYH